MAEKKKQNTAALVREAVEPVASGLGLRLWDVRFEKEGPDWFLRIFIDKDGGVDIDDCEAMSRACDPVIDELDPSERSYYLEVSSPGLGRPLRTDEHLNAYVGQRVAVKLIRPDEEGERGFRGELQSFDADAYIVLTENGTKRLLKKNTAYIKASDDEDLGGSI